MSVCLLFFTAVLIRSQFSDTLSFREFECAYGSSVIRAKRFACIKFKLKEETGTQASGHSSSTNCPKCSFNGAKGRRHRGPGISSRVPGLWNVKKTPSFFIHVFSSQVHNAFFKSKGHVSVRFYQLTLKELQLPMFLNQRFLSWGLWNSPAPE